MFKTLFPAAFLTFALAAAVSANTVTLANSSTDFAGSQGSNSWLYGYTTNPSDANSFTTSGIQYATHPNLAAFTSSPQMWALVPCCSPWLLLGPNSYVQPAAQTTEHSEYDAARRWTNTSYTGTVTLSGTIAHIDPNSTQQEDVYIYKNQSLVYSSFIAANAFLGSGQLDYSQNVAITPGDFLTFILAPHVPTIDEFDETTFSAVVTATTPSPEPTTWTFAAGTFAFFFWKTRRQIA